MDLGFKLLQSKLKMHRLTSKNKESNASLKR